MAADNDPDSRQQINNADESIRHLVELGYVDPEEVAAHEAARRRELQAQLRQAIDLKRHGRGQEAAAVLEALSVDDPDWNAPHQLLVEIYYSAAQWHETEAQLEWLAHHGVDNPRLALITAGIELARRDMKSALENLQYARYVEPKLPGVNTLLGTVLLRLGRWNEAEDIFREAVEQNPTDARARDGLAAICLKHGEYEDAADWALRALEQDMRLFQAHYHLGLALAHSGRVNEAIAALETAARIDNLRAAPYYWISRIVEEESNDARRSAIYRQQSREVIRRRRARSGG